MNLTIEKIHQNLIQEFENVLLSPAKTLNSFYQNKENNILYFDEKYDSHYDKITHLYDDLNLEMNSFMVIFFKKYFFHFHNFFRKFMFQQKKQLFMKLI